METNRDWKDKHLLWSGIPDSVKIEAMLKLRALVASTSIIKRFVSEETLNSILMHQLQERRTRTPSSEIKDSNSGNLTFNTKSTNKVHKRKQTSTHTFQWTTAECQKKLHFDTTQWKNLMEAVTNVNK